MRVQTNPPTRPALPTYIYIYIHAHTYHIPRVHVEGDEGDDLGAVPGRELPEHELDERGEAGVADLGVFG